MHQDVLNKYAMQCLWWHGPVLVTVTSVMLQPFPLKEISSSRFKALGWVMEKKMCQANLPLALPQNKQLGKNISLSTYMYIKYMVLATLFPL